MVQQDLRKKHQQKYLSQIMQEMVNREQEEAKHVDQRYQMQKIKENFQRKGK